MDFESRQKLAVEEINLVLKKYNLGLNPQMNYTIHGTFPVVKFVEITKPVGELVTETDVKAKTKKRK